MVDRKKPVRPEKEDILDEEVDYNSMGSFPASDPPSWTLGTKAAEHEIRPPGEAPSHQNDGGGPLPQDWD